MQNQEEQKNTKVYVGLSGGVDSSVSAALLQEMGYDVVGVFIKVWHPPFFECDWKKERRDAMRVCAQLDIPFKTLDLEEEYKSDVVDYMIEEYKAGRTPNPDVMCNSHIKFGAFLDWALDNGADYVATGHYTRKRVVNNQRSKMSSFDLLAGVDRHKDQSYFLWQLTQEQLAHILFPVGVLQKDKVRDIAENIGLDTADKDDSQGLCFVGDVDMKAFLSRFIDTQKGNVLNEDSEVVGRHEGAEFYTIGQRHGFDVTEKEPDSGPFYVIDKDVEENTLTVSENKAEEGPLYNAKEVTLSETNWIAGENPQNGTYQARIRYNQPLQKCELQDDTVVFESPQRATACGQSLVLYDGQTCLGGGVIASVSALENT